MTFTYLFAFGLVAAVALMFVIANLFTRYDEDESWEVPFVGIEWFPFRVYTMKHEWGLGAVLGCLFIVLVWGVVMGAGINALIT